jgi:hypothetical protein
MAKAHLTTKTGTTIVIEGSRNEVAALVRQIEHGAKTSGTSRSAPPTSRARRRQPKPTPNNLISTLIDGGFFRKPKDLGAVKVALEEMGHFYPVTTLSPTLLRLVRRHQLRRLRDKKRWLYTG